MFAKEEIRGIRNPGGGETVIANAAHHKEQGVRVERISGGNYEAAVLWNPDAGTSIAH